jgi:hypothetical protein
LSSADSPSIASRFPIHGCWLILGHDRSARTRRSHGDVPVQSSRKGATIFEPEEFPTDREEIAAAATEKVVSLAETAARSVVESVVDERLGELSELEAMRQSQYRASARFSR